jgi:hypothetical protein
MRSATRREIRRPLKHLSAMNGATGMDLTSAASSEIGRQVKHLRATADFTRPAH